MKEKGRIVRVSGPVVVADRIPDARMFDVVKVGKKKLLGEIIEIRGDKSVIQVYEETTGIAPEEPVETTGKPLSVQLGPGLISSIYDGIQRPLVILKKKTGDFIKRGVEADAIDKRKKWKFVPTAKKGQAVMEGDIIGTVQESTILEYRVMIPPGLEGKIKSIRPGNFKVTDTVCVLSAKGGDKKVTMLQEWPVRKGRPYKEKLMSSVPLITGQRILDTFFPLAKGGTACIPGPFGSGKTILQHQLSKWSDADVIIFIGCGERGNEMADVLTEFPELKDPKTGEPLMDRTVLIANTSNMPVAAREASVYTGATIAEYYRDMGYDVALMADSTSRWAEALREISGRLEEMPGEEGYPAYLAARLASFYERAGRAMTLGSKERKGSLSFIGAVSPPGGDFSEPITQGTLRISKVFWALDARLAYARHFPSIDWLRSYSLYLDMIEKWWSENVDKRWRKERDTAMALLEKEAELEEIVRLVGREALPPADRLILEVTRMIREDFLIQNAYDEIDTYTSVKKQFKMLDLILRYHDLCLQAIDRGVELQQLIKLPILDEMSRMKNIREKELGKFDDMEKTLVKSISGLGVKK